MKVHKLPVIPDPHQRQDMRLGRLLVWASTVTLKSFLYSKQRILTYVGLDSEYTKHSIAQGKKLMLNITHLSTYVCCRLCTVPIPLCCELLQPMATECRLCSASSKSSKSFFRVVKHPAQLTGHLFVGLNTPRLSCSGLKTCEKDNIFNYLRQGRGSLEAHDWRN